MTETSRLTTAASHLAAAKASHKGNDIAAMREALDRLGRSPDRTAALLLEAAKMYAAAGARADAVRSYLEAGTAFIDPEAELGLAREAFDAAHILDPVNLDVIFQIGRVHMIEGDAQKALAQFVHVLRHSKYTHAPALFEAACVYEQLGLHDQAVLTFRKVLDRDRSNVPAIIRMGQRLHSMGMLPEAIGYYVQAAEAAYAAGQIGTCRHVVNLVLGLDPNNHRARSILHDLNDLQEQHTAIGEPIASRAAETTPVAEPARAAEPDEASEPATPPPVEFATRMDLAKLAARYDKLKSAVDDIGVMLASMEETIAGMRSEIAALRSPAGPVEVEAPSKPAKALKPAKTAKAMKAVKVARTAKTRKK